MADQPARGKSKRGGLGKYLRARGRRGSGRPAEFGNRLVLEEEQEAVNSDDEAEENARYAKRELGTNADRYMETEEDPHVEQEPEPEVDLSSFLARQRLAIQEDNISHDGDDDDGIDTTLSSLPSRTANTRKNKTQLMEWDASMEELKREKEAAEAVWDLKSRFRQNQPRLAATHGTASRREQRTSTKIEDARHIRKPPDADSGNQDSEGMPASKADMEDFLDDLLS